MKNNHLDKKNELRKYQFKLRKKLVIKVKSHFNQNLFDNFFEKINFKNIDIFSSFISINSEIDTKQLNNYILNKGKILCLPVIQKQNNPLVFKKFTSYEDMIEGFMKIKEPPIENEILIPQVLFVPCLAFDNYGYRLGYGGGYYDRTFDYLKHNKRKFLSVGYAFDDQKVNNVPKDRFDMKLDYVITEKKTYSFV